jgi:hypothetical protein
MGNRRRSYKLQEGGEHYSVGCPFCGDKKHHLWISYVWGATIKVDNKYLDIGSFPAHCYRRNCLKDKENRKQLLGMISLNPSDTVPIDAGTFSMEVWEKEEFILPQGIPVNSPSIPSYMKEYIAGRGLDIGEMAERWQVQVALIDFYKPWPCLVFPIVQRGLIKGWQARFVGPEEWLKENDKPKYYIPRGLKKSWMLYNMDNAKYYPFAVMSEGVFDVQTSGPAGVGIFGKKPSTFQTTLLSTLWGNGSLIWVPDEDDPESVQIAEEKTEEWNKKGLFKKKAHVARVPSGDLAEYGRSEAWKLIQQQVPGLSQSVVDTFL